MAAVALGDGIWSMHVVAMRDLKLPVLFYCDAAITLASALVMILILHFTKRTRATLVLAGMMAGLGILVMH